MEEDIKGRETIKLATSARVTYTPDDAMLGLSHDTTLRVTVDPLSIYPDPQVVTLMWTATQFTFPSMKVFVLFRDDFEDDPAHRWQQIIDRHGKAYGDAEKMVKKLLSAPKPVVKRPPWSLCPRCGKPIWAEEGETDLRETRQLLEARMNPRWCLTCGQRFKSAGGVIECSDVFSTSDTLRTLDSMFPADQPNFDTIQIETGRARA